MFILIDGSFARKINCLFKKFYFLELILKLLFFLLTDNNFFLKK